MKTKNLHGFPHVPYYHPSDFTAEELLSQSISFYELMKKRRSIREFSDKPVDKKVIENLLKTAGSAPSGANKQPWTFCAVSNLKLKAQIRKAAEKEEYKNYHQRMNDQWIKDLAPLATDWHKPFLEKAPWLIVVFRKSYELEHEKKMTNYYTSESVGIACGFLISAIHHAGLVTLTHTPSPMNFLSEILERPENEKPFLLLPVGYPQDEVFVPHISKKGLDDISKFYM